MAFDHTSPEHSQGPRHKGDPIHIKKTHKGLLHEKLGVPQGKKIPASKLEAAKHSKSAAERSEATFAENAKGWGK